MSRSRCTPAMLNKINDLKLDAMSCVAKEDYQQAEQNYLEVIALLAQYDDTNAYKALVSVWFDLGFNVYDLTDKQKAIQAFQAVTTTVLKIPKQELNQDDQRIHSMAYWNLAQIYLERKDNNSYASSTQKALSIFNEIELKATSKEGKLEVAKFNKVLREVKLNYVKKMLSTKFQPKPQNESKELDSTPQNNNTKSYRP